jgi:ribosomal protein L11 methyltransferase
VTTSAADAELVADRLFGMGASAVSEQSGGAAGTLALVADLPVGAVADLAEAGVPHRVLEVGRGWRDAWREHARAWPAGRFVVRPPWVPPLTAPGAIEVLVDPGDAFGSGSHPTTRLCLSLVGDLVRGGERVLDAGCGSGVLGVGALLAGAARLRAVDVDPAAVRACAEVAAMNGVADRCEVDGTAVADVPGGFDLVLANLLVPVVEDLGADLVARVAPAGALVVGGLLEDHVPRALAALDGLAPAGERHDAGWVAVVLRRSR